MFLLFSTFCAVCLASVPTRPHVIFIVVRAKTATLRWQAPSLVYPHTPPRFPPQADDLGFGDLSLTGFSDVRTPHIDALHAQGLRLVRYYGQPVCSPSRAAIHTGRLPLSYGLQTYVIDPEGVDYGLDVRFPTRTPNPRPEPSTPTPPRS